MKTKAHILIFLLFILIGIFIIFGCGMNPTGGGSSTSTIKTLKMIAYYCYGGSQDDVGRSVCQSNSSYLIGYSYSTDGDLSDAGNHGGSDVWVLKVSNEGTKEWGKCYGGGAEDEAHGSVSTLDDKVVFVGSIRGAGGDVSGFHGADQNYNGWVVKLTSLGTIEWQNCIGATNGGTLLYGIDKTSDGGYIVTGQTEASNEADIPPNHGTADVLVSKLSSSGDIEWTKCYGGSGGEWGNSIIQTNDSGYIFAGTAGSSTGEVSGLHGGRDVWVVKLTSLGSLEWQKCYGGAEDDRANAIKQTIDGGYIVAGFTWSNDGDVVGKHESQPGQGDTTDQDDFWVLKLDSSGSMEWQACLGGDISDSADYVFQTTDGGYLVAGLSNSTGISKPNGDLVIFKLSSSGAVEWNDRYGGVYDEAVNGNNYGRCLYQDENGYYWVAGRTTSSNESMVNHGEGDYWLIKLASEESF